MACRLRLVAPMNHCLPLNPWVILVKTDNICDGIIGLDEMPGKRNLIKDRNGEKFAKRYQVLDQIVVSRGPGQPSGINP